MGETVDYLLRGTNSPHIVVGPLTWQPSDGTASKVWYFIVAGSEPGRGFRCDKIEVDHDDGDAVRMSLIAALARHRPRVVHVMDDEVTMAKLCEVLWPGERVTKLRKAIEADYASRGQAG